VRRRIALFIHLNSGVSLLNCAVLLERLLETMLYAFDHGYDCVLFNGRGTLLPSSERMGRSPMTGATIYIPGGKYYRFKCFRSFLKDVVEP